MSDDLIKLCQKLPQTRILVIGDMMLDRFIWGKVDRISPEAPVPVVRVSKESAHLGGSANVVTNIRTLSGAAVPVGVIGGDEPGRMLVEGFQKLETPIQGLVIHKDHATIQKTRIIAHHQQVVRVDREQIKPVEGAVREQMLEGIREVLPRVDAVIVSDYGKGVITRELLVELRRAAEDTMIMVDPKDVNFDHYIDMEMIKPNQKEAERMSGIAIEDEASLIEAATAIFEKLSCRRLLITRGEQGMALFDSPKELSTIPTRAREVFDVSGAGDTVIAVYTMARAAGGTPDQAARLANVAAGVVVGKLGTASLTIDELEHAVRHHP